MAEFNNLVDLFQTSCEKYKNNELFGTKVNGSWQWITYGDVATMVDHMRGALASKGIVEGDRVCVISNNRVEWAVAAYAVYSLKATFVPMYEAQKPYEWAFIINDCEAKAIIGATDDIFEKLTAMKAGNVDDNEGNKIALTSVEHIFGMSLPESNEASFKAMLKLGAANPVEAQQPDRDSVAGFVYTSGTTGNPKGVKLSHGNICSNINAIHAIFTFEPTDRSLSFLPWAHSFGQTCELHGLLSMGASLALNDEIPSLLPNLAEVKPTILFAVPRIFSRVYDSLHTKIGARPKIIQSLFHAGIAAAMKKNAGQSIGFLERTQLKLADALVFKKARAALGGQLRYAISGSAALNRDVASFIDALGIEVYEGYGLTETSPISTANFPGHRKIGSVGRAIPGVRIHIDTSVTNDDVDGEIVIYGPNIMKGYHNREKANNEVLMEDGGFRSGDMGRLDDEGYLYITGRIKEQYKLENGKYVVPSPLEEKLKLSSFIANAMLFGANKPYNVALIVPDAVAIKRWADETGKSADDIENNAEVLSLITSEIETHTKSFKGYERPKKIALIAEEFSIDNGMLTPTLKLKRRIVLKAHGDRIESLYT